MFPTSRDAGRRCAATPPSPDLHPGLHRAPHRPSPPLPGPPPAPGATAVRYPAHVIGAYPGSFNPPTVAHLAIAEAVIARAGLTRVDLVVSEQALGKDGVDRPVLRHRLDVLEAVAATRPWLGVRLTRHRLLADIAAGYDVLVLGADKWAQIVDPVWYGSATARDAAIGRLPRLAVVPRPPYALPSGAIHLLDLEVEDISSTAVRDLGRTDWMLPEAAEFAERTGAWVDPARYEDFLRADRSSPC